MANLSSSCYFPESLTEEDLICNALGCSNESTEQILIKAGTNTITLSVCKDCKKFFVDDDILVSNPKEVINSNRDESAHNDIISDNDTILVTGANGYV